MKQLEADQRNKKSGFVGILLGTLGASLLGNLLVRITRQGQGVIRAEEETIKIIQTVLMSADSLSK